YPAGVLDDLHGFNSGNLVEEPATAGVHEHGMALEFKQFERSDPLPVRQLAGGIRGEKAIEVFRRALDDHADIFISRPPDIFEECSGGLLVKGSDRVPQPIERGAQGRAPVLVPSGIASAIAPAVFTPATHAVRATPGAVLYDLRLMLRRMFFEILAIVRQPCDALLLDELQCIGQRHVAVAMMMSVTLAVGSDVHQLGPIPGIHESIREPAGELLTAGQQVLECDRLRDRRIVEKHRNCPPLLQTNQVRTTGIDFRSSSIAIGTRSDVAVSPRLVGRENRELDAQLSHHVQRLKIDRSLGQPHAFGSASEAVLEIADSPQDLSVPVMVVGQRQDHMVVSLRDRRSMAGESFLTQSVGFQNCAIDLRLLHFHPRQQGWAKVEADFGVVVGDFRDLSFTVENARGGIRRVALGSDALVPIVEGISRVLQFDGFKPRILSRRLIKVAMNADISFHAGSGRETSPWVRCRNSCSLLAAGEGPKGITRRAGGPKLNVSPDREVWGSTRTATPQWDPGSQPSMPDKFRTAAQSSMKPRTRLWSRRRTWLRAELKMRRECSR